MALSNTTNRVQTAALSGVVGGNTVATFNSRISTDADLKVYEVTTSATTLLILNSDYTLTKSLSGSLITGANVVATASAVAEGKFADGSVIVVIRETDYQQSSDYEPNAIIPADTLENDLDKLAMQTQQLKDDLTRSLRFSSTLTDAPDPNITLTAAERANKILGFNADGSEFAVTQEIGNYRSDWATGTVYSVRDIVKQASGSDASTLNNIYICNTSHTASGSYLTQFDTAKWDLIIDAAAAASSASAAAASASAAADDAADAEKLAITAEDISYTLSDLTTTGYSALHYAAKAAASASGAVNAKNDAETAQGLAESAQAAAELVYDNFDDRFLGAKATDPSTDNDGDALLTGALYFDTTNNFVKVYNGTSWQNATSSVEGVIATQEYTGDNTTQYFAFTVDQGMELVYLNGVKMLRGSDYECTSSNVSTTGVGDGGAASYIYFTTAPATGDVVSIVGFGQSDNTLAVPVSGGTFTGNVAYTGNIQVDDIVEKTSAHGVAIDGVTLKDGGGTFTGNIVIPDGGNIGSASDTDALTIDGSGNVGIGATNPAYKLEIAASQPWIRLNDTDGTTAYADFTTSSGSLNLSANPLGTGVNSYVSFNIENTERLRIDSSGHVIVPNGVTLGTAAGTYAAANTLDDYEEGTWSSTSLSSLVNVTFSGATTFSGRYTKIGNKVTLSTDATGVQTGTIAATNTFTKFTINGLPFSSASGQNAFGVVWDGYREMAGVCFMSSGTSSIFIYFDDISVGFTGSVVPRFSITYEV